MKTFIVAALLALTVGATGALAGPNGSGATDFVTERHLDGA